MSEEAPHGADGQQPSFSQYDDAGSGSEGEEHVEFQAPPPARRKIQFAAKTPRRPAPLGYIERRDMYCEEQFEDAERPDIQAYLAPFELSDQQEIALCRTYANMLSAKTRSVPRGPYKTKRSRTSHGDFE